MAHSKTYTATRPSITAEAFWQFSLETYAIEKVKTTCLALQDRHGADINMLLLAIWLDTLGYTLSDGALEALIDVSRLWQQEKLIPLRAKRNALRKNTAAYRDALEIELRMEKEEQAALIDALIDAPIDAPIDAVAADNQSSGSTAANILMRYAGHAALPTSNVQVLVPPRQT